MDMASKPTGTSIEVSPTGKPHVSGVDYGPKLSVEAVNRDAIVLRVGGHMAWAGRGHREYVRPYLIVFAIVQVSEYDGKTHYSVTPLVKIDVGRKKS